MKIKYYISGIFSVIALVFYSLPWTYGATHSALGFYIISFLWFLFAWILMLLHLILGIYNLEYKNNNWKHHITAFGVLIISYIILFIAISNGYMVTV